MSLATESLVIILPCYNEAATLPAVLDELFVHTRTLGITTTILVLDDGSSDSSATLAEARGAEVLRLEHTGLAKTYKVGLKEAVARGADYIVSLDADAQYDPAALPDILAKLKSGADLVLVERGATFYQPMPTARRIGHVVGRKVTQLATGLAVNDPVTGYRGYSRRAAQALQIRSSYTYTLETLMQVISLNLEFKTMTCAPRVTTRPSRLFKSPLRYMARQGVTLLSSAVSYRPPSTARLGLVLSWLILAVSAWLGASALGLSTTQEVLTFLYDNPAGALPLLILYMMRPLLFIPASLLTLTSGLLFGPLWGVAAATAGNLLAASTAHMLGSKLGVPKRFQTLVTEADNGRPTFLTVLGMRLTGIPHDLVSLLAGATRMNYALFLLSSLLGTLPITVLIVGLGYSGGAVLSSGAPNLLFMAIGLTLLGWLSLKRLVR